MAGRKPNPLTCERYIKSINWVIVEYFTAPGKKADVQPAYDTVIGEQVALIRDELERRYNTTRISRVLVSGGGANHLFKPLKDALLWGDLCKAVPDSNHANLLGAMTMLRLKALQG